MATAPRAATEHALDSDDILAHILSWFGVEDLCRVSAVSRRFHQFAMSRAWPRVVQQVTERTHALPSTRAELERQAAAVGAGAAMLRVPWLRTGGQYTLELSYNRPGLYDLFHPAGAGILTVRYVRAIRFDEDGTCAMVSQPTSLAPALAMLHAAASSRFSAASLQYLAGMHDEWWTDARAEGEACMLARLKQRDRLAAPPAAAVASPSAPAEPDSSNELQRMMQRLGALVLAPLPAAPAPPALPPAEAGVAPPALPQAPTSGMGRRRRAAARRAARAAAAAAAGTLEEQAQRQQAVLAPGVYEVVGPIVRATLLLAKRPSSTLGSRTSQGAPGSRPRVVHWEWELQGLGPARHMKVLHQTLRAVGQDARAGDRIPALEGELMVFLPDRRAARG